MMNENEHFLVKRFDEVFHLWEHQSAGETVENVHVEDIDKSGKGCRHQRDLLFVFWAYLTPINYFELKFLYCERNTISRSAKKSSSSLNFSRPKNVKFYTVLKTVPSTIRLPRNRFQVGVAFGLRERVIWLR